jgi:hypothetical protein
LFRSKSTRFSTTPMLRPRPDCSVWIARSAWTRRVISEPMTKTIPETFWAMITASVTASTGGVSMTTQSNGPCARFASR